MCRIEHGIGIGHGSGLCGQGGEIYRNGACHIVDSHSGKLPFGSHHSDVTLAHRAFGGIGVAILVGVVADFDSLSVRDADGVGALGDDHLCEGVAATGIGTAILFPQAQCIGTIKRVSVQSLIPVDILVIASRCGVGLYLVVVARVVGNLEIGTFDPRIGKFHEVLAIIIACRLRIGEPLLGTVAIDVIGVGTTFYCVKGEEAVVLGCLRRCRKGIAVHIVAIHHRVHVFGLSLTGHCHRSGYLISHKRHYGTNHKQKRCNQFFHIVLDF